MTEIKLSDNLESINECAFLDCSALKSVYIPGSVKYIGEGAFLACSRLKYIIISEGVSSIESLAFGECFRLFNIVLPASLSNIADDAFDGCENLYQIVNNSNIPVNPGIDNIAINTIRVVEKDSTYKYREDGIKYHFTDDGFVFTESNGSYNLFAYIGTEETVTFPKDIYGCPYTVSPLAGVKNIIIPEGITEIYDSEFFAWGELTGVIIPDSVTSIGNQAFAYCRELEHITLPSGLINIGWSAFSACENLSEIMLPDSVKCIGSGAFRGCTNLTKMTIGKNVTEIGAGAFSECPISELSLSKDNLSYIIKNGILYNKNITELLLVTKGVTDVCIPSTVSYIFSGAFSNDTVRTVSFESGSALYSIPDGAFSNCSSLVSIDIPYGMSRIGYSAFESCTCLTEINIPDSVSIIEKNAFSGCSNLKKINVSENNPDFCSLNGILYNKEQTSIIAVPQELTGEVSLSVYLESIEDFAFYGCENITDIILHENVKSIGSSAFSGCSSLRSIYIPSGVKNIGSGAFNGCSSLQSVSIPSGVSTISDWAFANCDSLSNINIPKGVTSIEENAFYDCYSLTSIEIPEGVLSIGDSAFEYCEGLTSIVIPSGLKNIGEEAFIGCPLYVIYNNSDLPLKAGNEDFGYIAENAKMIINSDNSISYANDGNKYILTADGFLFSYSDDEYVLIAYIGKLETVTLPENINGESYTLNQMRGVRNVVVPECFTMINDWAFSGCESLSKIQLPDSISYIGSAFPGCTGLKEINIPDNVSFIGEYAFCDTGLESVHIPYGAYVGDYCFARCPFLKSVTLTGIRSLPGGVFSNCPNLSEIIFDGEYNEWRFVEKAGDWDNDSGNYIINCLPDSGIYYEADDNLEHFYVSGHGGINGNATVPEKYSGRNVVGILPDAFLGNDSLTSLLLPDSITYIGEHAFKSCTNLQKINIPEGVKSLEFDAFGGCESLTEMKNVPINMDDCFGYFFGAESYEDSGNSVPASLTSVYVRNGSVLPDHVFENCENIRYIFVNDADSIGDYAFAGCKALLSFTIPENVKKIGDFAFSGCIGLTSVTIPDSVTSVGNMIFDKCSFIREIAIGKGLKLDNIPEYMEKKTAENGTHVNSSPLFGIDKSLSMLERYIVAADHPYFMTDSFGVLYEKMKIGSEEIPVAVVDAPCGAKLSGYELPGHIVEICPYAFAYSDIVSIDLEYVRLIGNHAFFSATELIYLNLSEPEEEDTDFTRELNKVQYSQYIRNSAFMGCTSLQNVNVGTDMIVGIEELAFADCPNLKAVMLGKNIQVIGLRAFGSTGASSSSIEFFFVDSENTYFKSIDGVLYKYNTDGTLTLLMYPAYALVKLPEIVNGRISYEEEVSAFREDFTIPDGVSAIESYAFENARKLINVTVNPKNDIVIGDYAFANSIVRKVTLGENVVSVGLKRGEGEYTVFANCPYLTEIEVLGGNPYYTSKGGVLFNAGMSTLIKYPVQKAGNIYYIPKSVSAIASMAFKENNALSYVIVQSPVAVIGLEAFYACSHLTLIYFDNVYAPTMVLENAFTTYVSVESASEEGKFNPRTIIGYSRGYYEDGESGEKGWKNYEKTYTILEYSRVPDFKTKNTGGRYAVVVFDSSGEQLGNTRVSLTDPNGNTETVNADDGVAMFTDLLGVTGFGMTVDYERPYSITVADLKGEYFTYTNPSFYLDREMKITVITLTKSPSAYGVNCGGTDINSETAEINIYEYGYQYDEISLKDESLGYVEGNIEYKGEHPETVEVTVIGYCDEKSGWNFTENECGLYQNGKLICNPTESKKLDDGVLFIFDLPVKNLSPEVAIEARLTAAGPESQKASCSTALNIHVFDFSLSADDVDINSDTLSMDLGKGGEVFTKLFGSGKIDVNIGKNVSITAQTNGSEITLDFSAKAKKENSKTHGSYKEGYEYCAGARANNKNTYFFTFNGSVKDSDGKKHNLVYNIRFARDHETEGYYYYRCYVYEGERGVNYSKEIQTFYGAVNCRAATEKGRSGLSSKAFIIFSVHLASAKHVKDIDKIKKLGSDAQYSEAIKKAPHAENESTFTATLDGSLVFRYDKDTVIRPVSGEITGKLSYSFKHNSQFVVWVIPIVLEVEVNVDGKVELKLKADSWRDISFEEIKMTLSAEISAKLGVGCSAASVGLYGSVGTVFVLDFYPEFGPESWVINGEIGAYVKALWWTKQFVIGKWSNVDLLGKITGKSSLTLMNSAYLASGYSMVDPVDLPENPRLVIAGNKIYKIYTTNAYAIDPQTYNEYNCCKLASAVWDNEACDWKYLGLIDDNGYNDMSYYVTIEGNSLRVVYSQQTVKMKAEDANDLYSSVSNSGLKCAVVSDSGITVREISESGVYKYNISANNVDGIPVAVWTENNDNNVFGVSPRNYIDENGEPHIYSTNANSVWMSRYVNGSWSEPHRIAGGLSAVTGLVIDSEGNISYIVDENGDLADTEDRVLYYRNAVSGKIYPVNDTEKGSVVNLALYNGDAVYYYQSKGDDSGLYVLNDSISGKNGFMIDNEYFSDSFKFVYRNDGSTLGMVYTALRAWENDGVQCDGTALYGIFCEENIWGEPVELSCFTPQNNVYIDYFDCVTVPGKDEIIFTADLSDRDGVKIESKTMTQYIKPEIVVTDFKIDYENHSVIIRFRNNGIVHSDLYASVDREAPEILPEILLSGTESEYSVPFVQNETDEHYIAIYDGSGNTVFESEISLKYSSLVPHIKQVVIGNINALVIAVSNEGNMGNYGYLAMRQGSYPDKYLSIPDYYTVFSENSPWMYYFSPVNIMNGSEAETVWISSIYVEAGEIEYILFPLEEYGCDAKETAFSLSVVDQYGGDIGANPIAYWSYKEETGVSTTLDGDKISEIPVPVMTEKKYYEFDKTDRSDIIVRYTSGADNKALSVRDSGGKTVSADNYTIDSSSSSLTLKEKYLLTLPSGDNRFTIVFSDNSKAEFTVYSVNYYNVTRKDWNGTVISKTLEKEGTVPSCDTVPERDSTSEYQYVFLGWDINGDGNADSLHSLSSDITLTAVYKEIRLISDNILYGDVNGDGIINGFDLVRLKKYIADYDYTTGVSAFEISAGADVNGDGSVNGTDVVILTKYISDYDYDLCTSSVVLGPKTK